MSQSIKVVQFDTVAPVPATFNLLTQPDNNVVVTWVNTPSDDAKYMELYRQIDDTGKVVLLKHIEIKKKKNPTQFIDPYTFNGEMVQYSMIVYDEAGNKSVSVTNNLQTKGERPGCISNLKVYVINTENKKQIKLTWQNDRTAPISRYVIYRKEDDGRMLPVSSVRANNTFYEDDKIALGSKYIYIVRPISTERVCPSVYSEEVIFTGTVK